jgi:hypothetical protein
MNINSNDEFNTTIFSSEEKINRDTLAQECWEQGASYVIPEILVKELGWNAAICWSIIKSYSSSERFFSQSDTFIAEKMEVEECAISNLLKVLSENKNIFTLTWNTSKGNIRHIITDCNVTCYWRNWLRRPIVPREAQREFIRMTYGEETVKFLGLEEDA